ncbi:hypothetical protein BDF14DRAFT_972875 [Spinellus fusiger]|nr:hypothetical protein BDF14DRAFT_972875 [Spinellus fusiger]
MIKSAQLLMEYQLKCADQQYESDWRLLEKETMAEKHGLMKDMYLVLEEKRKGLKKDKDGEVGIAKGTPFSTRRAGNRKRHVLQRTLPCLKPEMMTSRRRYAIDRMRETANVSQALAVRNEEELDADLFIMPWT